MSIQEYHRDHHSPTFRAAVLGDLGAPPDLDAPLPYDEHAFARENPPAYDDFESVYDQWCASNKAKEAVAALDKEEEILCTETELKDAQDALRGLKEKSQQLFKDSHHNKRHSLLSSMGFGKSNATTFESTEELKQLLEAEEEQDLVVKDLTKKVTQLKQKRAALAEAASREEFDWMQLSRIADEKLSSTPEFAESMGSAMEKLAGAQNAYTIGRTLSEALARSRLAAQASLNYFTKAVQLCADIRGTAAGRAALSLLGGGFAELDKLAGYRESVNLAAKAQVCLNELFRVMEPHEYIIPEETKADYEALRKMGLLQMSKIYNLMYGGPALPSGVAGSVKVLLQKQDDAYEHLARLTGWVQSRMLVCAAELEKAGVMRGDVRQEVAELWKNMLTK